MLNGPRPAIEAAAESETAFGGRERSWGAVGGIWLAFGARAVRERAPAAPSAARDTVAPGRTMESCLAEGRAHPQARRGRRLNVDGERWRIAAVEPGAPGRIRLHLIKD